MRGLPTGMERVDLVERLAEAFNAHDAAAMGALFASDGWLRAEDGESYLGRPEVESGFADLFETWAEISVAHRECFQEGPNVVWLATIRGRARSVDLELAFPYAYAIEVRDGLLASVQIFPEDDAAFHAAGLSPRR